MSGCSVRVQCPDVQYVSNVRMFHVCPTSACSMCVSNVRMFRVCKMSTCSMFHVCPMSACSTCVSNVRMFHVCPMSGCSMCVQRPHVPCSMCVQCPDVPCVSNVQMFHVCPMSGCSMSVQCPDVPFVSNVRMFHECPMSGCSMCVSNVRMFHECPMSGCSMSVQCPHVPWVSDVRMFCACPMSGCSICVQCPHVPCVSNVRVFHGCPMSACSTFMQQLPESVKVHFVHFWNIASGLSLTVANTETCCVQIGIFALQSISQSAALHNRCQHRPLPFHQHPPTKTYCFCYVHATVNRKWCALNFLSIQHQCWASKKLPTQKVKVCCQKTVQPKGAQHHKRQISNCWYCRPWQSDSQTMSKSNNPSLTRSPFPWAALDPHLTSGPL